MKRTPVIAMALVLAACGGTAGATTSATQVARASVQATATTPTPAPRPAFGLEPTGPIQVGQVVHIVDGDTIDVVVAGAKVRVRYIGMDTPETHSGIEWLGPEASAANEQLVMGREVVLEKDVSETDQYGRALRYVWLHDGATWTLVNLELIREGFAAVLRYPPDVKYIDPLFVPAEAAARAAGIGRWAASLAPVATAVPTPLGFVPPPPNRAKCEPSYPGICIPINSPDLDCGDITFRRFVVLWNVPNPDPHRFDGNHDGVGCEAS